MGWDGLLVTWVSVLMTHISTPRSRLVEPLGEVWIMRFTTLPPPPPTPITLMRQGEPPPLTAVAANLLLLVATTTDDDDNLLILLLFLAWTLHCGTQINNATTDAV